MTNSFHEAATSDATFLQAIESKSFIPQQEGDMKEPETNDHLVLYGHKFSSRLLLGTARYASPSLLDDAIRAADPAMLTVSLRRQVSASPDSGQSFWNLLRETQRTILPNTAGCLSPHEAVKTACMARELFQTKSHKA
jgi:thiazole synthase